MTDWAAAWARRNGCAENPQELPPSGEVSGVRYTNCEDNADVIFYITHGGGYTLPGGEPLPAWIVGHTTMDVDATALMWALFEPYSICR
ncbi:hypothetical protein ACFLZW_02760 [Chloroflexota bacterium]